MTSEVGITEIAVPEMKSSRSPYLPFRNSVHLSQAEAHGLMSQMLSGEMAAEEIAAILEFLRGKGETLAELVGFATAIRELTQSLEFDQSNDPIVDTCGTGGDGANTFNISTATAFVVAGTGLRVAKHGNRRISSRCGSADVLEQLGVCVALSPEAAKSCIGAVGIGFLYAPMAHPAMRHAAEARGLVRGRTVFNLLGPLTNPVRARAQLIGAFSVRAAEMLAQAASRLGIERALVVHGGDGLDEITTTTFTTVFQVGAQGVEKGFWTPEDFEVPLATLEHLAGGDAETNAAIIRTLLEGATGATRDIVLANAAAALLVAERAGDFKTAMELARESLNGGSALRKLNDLIAFTRELPDEGL
jgi:anthranilate phosphoribosyltransferase